MNKRSRQPDTAADVELRACLSSEPPKSFSMVAGAGSGKTTSLIKGLSHIIEQHGKTLRARGQKAACITYTEIAAKEIWEDVGNHPLVHVSTIHSFLWTLIKTFQTDIRRWVTARIAERITELQENAAAFGPRVQERTRVKNRRDTQDLQTQLPSIASVPAFRYGSGSDYPRGILGHDDIIRMVPSFLSARPLLRKLLVQQFPFVFVDESQDTSPGVVEALVAVDRELGDSFCLGFFGDPMQQIYMTGIGEIPVSDDWASITKQENFRCPLSVLTVANAIRRSGDGLEQTRGRTSGPREAPFPVQGTFSLFVLPADAQRDLRLDQVRSWIARDTADAAWLNNDVPATFKTLVVVHRMAAKRLGFENLFDAFHGDAPSAFKESFLDGTAWPVRPFLTFILPLASATEDGRSFDAMEIVRTSPLLDPKSLNGVRMADRLARVRDFARGLDDRLAEHSNATVADVLRFVQQSGALQLDPRLLGYLNFAEELDGVAPPVQDERPQDEDELARESHSMERFLTCDARQFWGYQRYIDELSPFSTQQGVKGAEFERVLVVLDDEESNHNQFSYEKYLGIKPLSDRDLANRRDNKETSVERTRRLFYVCCTRAMKDLVVVLFTADPVFAIQQVKDQELFPEESIFGSDELLGVQP